MSKGKKKKKKKKEGARGALSLNISSPTTTTTTTLTPYPHCQHPHPPLPSLFPPFFMPSPPSPSPPSCLHPSSPSCPLSYSLPLLHSNQSIIQTPPPGHPTTKTKWLRALFLGSLVREVGLTATRWKSHFFSTCILLNKLIRAVFGEYNQLCLRSGNAHLIC